MTEKFPPTQATSTQKIHDLCKAIATVNILVTQMRAACSNENLENTTQSIWETTCQSHTEELIRLLEKEGRTIDGNDREFIETILKSTPENIKKMLAIVTEVAQAEREGSIETLQVIS